jgi:uncharacterized protein (TIGR02996 family)
MTDLQSFLAALRDRPDDDGLRLVFADWCDENGDADRAAFLRLPPPKRAARFRCFVCGHDHCSPSFLARHPCPDCGYMSARPYTYHATAAGDLRLGDLLRLAPDGRVTRHTGPGRHIIGIALDTAQDGQVVSVHIVDAPIGGPW